MEIVSILKIAGKISDAQEAINLNDKNQAIYLLNKAKEMLVLEQYFSEFRGIDGLNQHPEGNFKTWLKNRNTYFSMKWEEWHAPCPNNCNDGYLDDEEYERCPFCFGEGSIELHPVTKKLVNQIINAYFTDITKCKNCGSTDLFLDHYGGFCNECKFKI